MKIHVNMKSIGRRKASVKPAVIEIKGRPSTLRELILALVEAGVEEYNRRAEDSKWLTYLTEKEIDEKAQTGKIGFGINYGGKKAALPAAQTNAIQCFEDGIYRIFQGNEPLEALDTPILIGEETVFTFVRLTMLAGRMW